MTKEEMKTPPTRLRQKPKKKKPEPGIPYHYKPEELRLEDWQIALRQQFVKDKSFEITKLDDERVFGDYKVYNPETKNNYKVAIRSQDNSLNFCSCLDYKTNHLGTCKHIEAVLLQIRSKPKQASILKKGYHPAYSSIYLQYGKERKVKMRIGTDHSRKFTALAKNFFDRDLTYLPKHYLDFMGFLQQARQITPDFRCYDDALEFVIEQRSKFLMTRRIDEKFPSGKELKGLLKTDFFEYQNEGILFAAKAGRCIIADDMGLGKTIQAIGSVELMRKEGVISKVLIICPTSLKYQWQSEIKKFTSSDVLVIEGLPHNRLEQYRSDNLYKILSYHTVGNDIEAINQMEPDLVILDEAQRIKNWKTKVAQSVKKIKSTYAIVLTGTPLENKLEDLYSIIQFVDPYRLGPYYWFMDRYQTRNQTGKVTGFQHLHEIHQKLSDIMIRRKKSEVLTQLPKRMDKNLFVSMTKKQMEWHDEFKDIVAKLVHKWIKQGFLLEKDRQRLLINLNLMRMVCDSTYIIDQETRHDTKIEELMNIILECVETGDEKIVVFSQWERMTRLVARELVENDIQFEYLHGGVPSAKRKQLFDHFNNNPECRVFLSTDAGSTGLNLQSASLICNLDIPWNPAVLEQRIGRIHRLGQKKNVSVINFVSKGTIEHRMLGVLKFKSSLAEGVLDNGDDTIIMDENRFRAFMKTIEEITAGPEWESSSENSGQQEEENEALELNFPEAEAKQQSDEEIPETSIAGDDDIPQQGREPVMDQTKTDNVEDPATIIQTGLSFFSGLMKTLSSPESTEKLVKTIVDKDEASGKTYLKIPVESEKLVNDVLGMLGKLLNANRG
ncbi:MAG: DEAD/DEAH box helicase [Bacteroidetes bacterium]|nr:DEAD/DEAH box helicase [Bacteroidota bacterium]